MAITTSVKKIGMSGGELILILETQNSNYPGEVLEFDKKFPDSTPAGTIRDAVQAAVALYWQVRALLRP
jgi:hypothetical protein